MKRYDVITVGAATRDVFLRSPSLPLTGTPRHPAFLLAVGAKFDIPTMVFATGGGATNAAATFAHFGFRTAFFGKTGADRRGDLVLEDLRAHGVDTSLVARDASEPTAYSIILTDIRYGRTILTHRTENRLRHQHLAVLQRHRARLLYVTSLGGDVRLLAALLRLARRHRMAVACNPGQGELQHTTVLRRLLRDAAVVLLNREEANRFAGTRALPSAGTARRLVRQLSGTVVVTDGKRGAVAATQTALYRSGTHRLARIVEWTGAGDAFGSGFVSGLLHSNGDIVTGLQYGTANAESVVQHIGAKTGLLRRPPPAHDRIPVRRTGLKP